MTLPASGRITLGDIAAEFGGTAPHKLSEYVRGGTYVPMSAKSTIKTTVAGMKLSDYYGAAKASGTTFPAAGGGQRFYFDGTNFSATALHSGHLQAGTYVVGASGNAGETFRLSGVRITPVENSSGKYSFSLDVVATENSPGGHWQIDVDNNTAAYSIASGSWLARSWYGTDYLMSVGFVSFSDVSKKLRLTLGYSSGTLDTVVPLTVDVPFE